MKKNQKLILLSALFIALIGALSTKAFSAGGAAVDCSVTSPAVCTSVELSNGTVLTIYGQAKPPKQ